MISNSRRLASSVDGHPQQSSSALDVVERHGRAVSEADSLDDALEATLDALRDGLGAARVAILLVDGHDTPRLAAWRGHSEAYRAAIDGHSPWPAGEPAPALLAAADVAGERSLGPLRELLLDEGLRAALIAPLTHRGARLGHLLAGYGAPRLFTEADRRLARILADQLSARAARLDGGWSGADALRAARRRQCLPEAAAAFASSLDLGATLEQVADLAVPALADWCAIHLRHGAPEDIALAHRDPGKRELARRALLAAPPPHDASRGHGGVLRTGRPEVVRVVTDAMLGAYARDEQHLAALRELGFHSWAVVPIRARGEVIGTLSLVNGAERGPLDDDDITLAQELADHSGAALDNARLFGELQESQERLRYALDAGRMGTWSWDPATGKLAWSESLAAMHGIPFELAPTSFDELLDHVHPDDRAAMRDRLDPTRPNGRPTQYRALRSDGAIRWFEAHSRLIPDAQGQPVRMAGVCADITDRKQTEIDLAGERERLAVTLRSIGDAVVTTDTCGLVRMLNRPAEELLGWKQADAAGRPVEEVVEMRGARRADHPVAAVLAHRKSRSRRAAWLVARDGTEREITHTASPIRDRAGHVLGVVLVFRDVTTERRVEAELARASKLESLGVLAGGIAHDFNNVLTAITANLSIAERRLAADHPAYERVTSAARACERARDLTSQLLTFARGGAPVKAATSIAEVVRESAAFALQGARSRAEIDLAEDLWPVDADAGQISQVLHNLVLNADQAMPNGGIVQVDVCNQHLPEGSGLPLAAGGYVRIRVRDAGIGIAPADLSRVFDPFFTTRAQGTGLGLATSYSIVHRHGGHLAVESDPGVGSCFSVWLPRAWEAPAPGSEDAEPQRGAGRVLVMDDDPAILHLAGDCLRELGYDARFATDGREAVARYDEAVQEGRPFDCVIVDLTVPGGMGGREALARLRERWPASQVIVSSGYSNDPVMAGYREEGFVGVLRKPYRVEDLGRVLAAALQR